MFGILANSIHTATRIRPYEPVQLPDLPKRPWYAPRHWIEPAPKGSDTGGK